jgi:hypothetical protein
LIDVGSRCERNMLGELARGRVVDIAHAIGTAVEGLPVDPMPHEWD